jgi:hypothetical protein
MNPEMTTIHVSPAGNDGWSGLTARLSGDGRHGPVATLERARDLARAARQTSDPPHKVEVLLHDGVYRRSEALVLTAEDSGTPLAPIVWRGPGAVRPVVTGLQPLDGAWEPSEDGIWSLRLPPGAAFRQLFCKGRRLARTRWPKEGYLNVYAFAGAGEEDHKRRFRFLKGDVRRWQNLDDVEFVIIHNWSESRLFVEGLDETADTVQFSGSAAYPFDFGGWNAYYVKNVKEALTEPGQWYLDCSTSILYLILPEDVVDPNMAEFAIPVADALLELRGTENEPVQNIRIEGIAFTGTRWQMGATGYANGGGAPGPHVRPAGITFEQAEACELYNCVIDATAGYAVELNVSDRCTVAHTEIRDAGGGGVIIFDGSDNTVADCEIHHCGRLYFGGTGIVNPSGVRTHIHHNHIHHMPYCGIRGGNWGSELREIIEYNHVHHVMLVLDDGAGIFNAGIGSIIRNNLVHDCIGGRRGFALGLYLDEYRTGVLMEKNVVYNTGSSLLHLHNNYGHTIVNNIFANGGPAQLSWTHFHGTHFGRRIQPYRHPLHTFQRNIVYWRAGCLSHNLDCNRWDLASQPDLIDKNVYWKAGDTDLEVPRLGLIPAHEVRLGLGHCAQPGVGHDTFADWQALGLDRHSLNVDPLFVDPEHDDFRLQESSPAYTLGFEPIDLSQVGPRPWPEKL